jgi:hypothetical protein
VHDLVPHVNGSLVACHPIVEGQLNGANRALDTSTKAAGRSDKDSERHWIHLRP